MIFEALTIKEIFWGNKPYKAGEQIRLSEEDMRYLQEAGVIGAIKKIEVKEYATVEAPENAMNQHGNKRKNR